MNPTLIFSIAALMLGILGGYLLKQHGQAKFDAGHASGLLDCATNNVIEAVKDKADFEKITTIKQNLTPDALDADLIGLRIMREESDY